MLVYRLSLKGFISNTDRDISTFHSWPTGKTYKEAERYIESFKTAFDLRKVKIDYYGN